MTNSPASNSSQSFFLLDERIQRWIWQAGWSELKDIQERAIPVLLEGRLDVIISAATAAGKTEAAFMPILTKILRDGNKLSSVVYVSPLKALINDQWGRLEALCNVLDLEVTPWHGDISATRKKRFMQQSRGCLLITPESLEAMLITHGSLLGTVFSGLCFIVVDELHAFIDSERGIQLQSLLHRIDLAIGRSVPRVGLSATLGEMILAAEFLRPGGGKDVEILESKETGQELKVLIKGYLDTKPTPHASSSCSPTGQSVKVSDQELESSGMLAIGEDLFNVLRGSHNLVFPNCRGKV